MNIERLIRPLLLALLLSWSSASGQIQHGGEPIGGILDPSRSEVPFIEMPSVDEAELRRADSLARASGEKVLRFAKNHEVSIDPGSEGVWKEGPRGREFWRIGIRSEGARSLSFGFDPFNLSTGAKLFIYTPDQGKVLGSFVKRNGGDDERLATLPIPGDEAVIELVLPKGEREANELRIHRVSHAYRDILGFGKGSARGFGDAGDCNMNVNCPDGQPWQEQKRAVGMIIENGSRLCSGALVNNTEQDGTPYFLSAAHCLNAGGPTSGWVFLFNYESPNCSDQNGPTDQSISGATLRADNEDSDFALLELDAAPPDAYEVFYAGWDHSGNTPDSTVSIHHPRGDIKKISFDDDPPVSDQFQNSIPNGEWRIMEWDRNTTTEGGSSGGPLFDQDGRIVGQLHGGQASCGNSVNDYFGKFSISWDHNAASDDQLAYWLDPNDSNFTSLQGYDPILGDHPHDVALTRILAPQEVLCSNEEFRAKVEFQNRGNTSLTELELYLILGQDTLQKLVRTGSWSTGERDTVIFSSHELPSGTADTLSAGVREPNGMNDGDLGDNEEKLLLEQRENGRMLRMELRTDCYGSETSWELRADEGSGDTLYRAGTNSYPGTADQPQQGGYEVEAEFCLSKGTCYSLKLHDSYNDGMVGSNYDGCDTDGKLSISTLQGRELVKLEDPDFGGDTSLTFCVDSIQVPDTIHEPELSVHPNPNPGRFRVELQGVPGNYILDLFDMRGRSVFRSEFRMTGAKGKFTAETGHADPGLYILQVNGPAMLVRKKLIILE